MPAGTRLTPHHGDITVTTPGTVIDSMDVHGFVTIRAANVTIRNSVLRGGKATSNRGIVTNYGYANLVVEDTSFIPEFDTVYQDGVKGSDFTLRRVYITGNVDSVKVQGSGVRIESSLLENTTYYASDPSQGGGPTHNDGIQMQKGAGNVIVGNTIRGQQNFPVLIAGAIGDNSGTVVKNNWLDGGHCTMKVQELSYSVTGAQIIGNRFGPNRRMSYCQMHIPAGQAEYTESGNVMEATGAVVHPYTGD